MLFQRKIERAQQWLKERNQTLYPKSSSRREEDLPDMEELKRQARQENMLDKGDLPAMILAALITILPVCILVLLALVAFVFFL
jgi:hypothetical protein